MTHLVDVDDLERAHSTAHLTFMKTATSAYTGRKYDPDCRWCELLEEVRSYRAAGPAIAARATSTEPEPKFPQCPVCGATGADPCRNIFGRAITGVHYERVP